MVLKIDNPNSQAKEQEKRLKAIENILINKNIVTKTELENEKKK